MTDGPAGALKKDGLRPTVRDIARLLGTTATTVSRALRNSPKISVATRARIHQAARDIGYRPDPEMAKLMHHLRSRGKPRFHGVIAAVSTRSPGERDVYFNAIIDGARRTADGLGYILELFHVGERRDSQRGLQRILASRGIEGVMLLPMTQPLELPELLDWEQYAAVAATASVRLPHLHRITPNQFANTQTLCVRLSGLGYRRIGLVVRPPQDLRVNHAFTAAVMWHNTFNGGEAVPPFFFDEIDELNPNSIATWLRRARPDAIIVTDEAKCRILSDVLERTAGRSIGLASTNTTLSSPWTGIDEQPAQVGATAIEVLTGMIQRGVRGVPARPTATLVEGVWCDGRSCPARNPEGRTGLHMTRASGG
jgi:DNA-binding LacI/PurR family transcriptional regulator